jgi:hypothetical protein
MGLSEVLAFCGYHFEVRQSRWKFQAACALVDGQDVQLFFEISLGL